MIGTILLDSLDIYQTYGVYVVEGGLGGLLQYPELKEPDKIDWFERNGIEVDLSNPKLSSKTFKIDFAVVSGGNYSAFLNILKDGNYHVFEFKNLYLHKKLRLVSMPEFSGDLIVTFSLEFSDDFSPIENRNILINPIINEVSNNYGFGYRTVYLKEGVEYLFYANGNSKEALNGHYLAVFLYLEDWSFAVRLDIKSKTNRTYTSKITAPISGLYHIQSYYYDASSPREGSVQANWYKIEEYGLQDFAPNVFKSFVEDQNVEIDSKNIFTYGIMFLESFESEIKKLPELKSPLVIDNSNISGSIVTPENLNYKSKKMKMSLILIQFSMKKALSNYYSFLYDLTQPGVRTLAFNGKSHKFYYKSSSFKAIHVGRKIWIEFDIDIEITKYENI